MAQRVFREMIQAKWAERKSVCVGLDTDRAKMPEIVRVGGGRDLSRFNSEIIDATKDLVCAYKINVAFYEAMGTLGTIALHATVNFARFAAPDVPIIGDMKRGDIDNTNLGYVKAAFEYFGFDAVTVHNYLGREAMRPFLDMKGKGIFVLCRTSNKGGGEFQNLSVVLGDRQMPLYQYVAHRVATAWNENGNCGLVVGATCPEELAQVRAIVGDDMPILLPGIGAQGGDLEASLKAGRKNLIVNASRSIIFASSGPDFAQAARRETLKLHEAISRFT